jgi:hypothetical protein
MVKIINPMQGSDPLAQVLSNLGQQMWGDRSGGMLKAEQLYALQMENREKEALAQEYLQYGTPEFDPRRIAARAGLAGDTDYANRHLYLAGNIDGAESQAATNAGVGAGGAYSSTYGGFAKTLAEAARANDMASVDRRRGDDLTVAENARQFNMTPEPVMLGGPGGTPGFVPRSGIFGGTGPAIPPQPILSNTQNQARVYNLDPPPTDSLAAAAYAGAAPSMDQMRAAQLEQQYPGLTPLQQRTAVGAQPSKDDVMAEQLLSLLPAMPQENQYQILGANLPNPPAAPSTWNYRAPDGTPFTTNDQMAARGLALDCRPLPPGGMRVGAEMTGDPSTWTNAVKTDLQSDDLAYRKWNALTNMALPLTDDPTLFGMGGLLRSRAQDLIQGFGGVPVIGQEFAALLTDTTGNPLGEEAARALIPEFYDPRLSEVEALWGLLIYQGAAVLTGQQGRSVSDADVQNMRRILGDPRSFFASNQSMKAKLQIAMNVVNAYSGITKDALGQGGAPGAPAATPPTPAAPPAQPAGTPIAPNPMAAQPPAPVRITGDAEYLALPPGTRFIGPDGLTRIKP